MKKSLKDWKEEYEYYSSTASTIVRNLGLGGIAIVWIFKNTGQGDMLPEDLIQPLFALVICLCLDLAQYVTGSIIWYSFFVYHEKNTKEKKQDNIQAPEILPIIITILYILKIAALIVAYYFIIRFMIPKL